MITTHCPRCSETIRLPADQVPADAYAECPLCRETFPASEVIERLPPMLSLVGADGQPLSLASSYEEQLEPAFESAGADMVGGESVPTEPALSQPIYDPAPTEIDSPNAENPFFDPAALGTAAVGAVAAGAAAIGLAGASDAADQADDSRVDEIGDKLEAVFDRGVDEYEDPDIDQDPTDVQPEAIEEEQGGLLIEEPEELEDESEKTLLLDTWQEDQGNEPDEGAETLVADDGVLAEVGAAEDELVEFEEDQAPMQFVPAEPSELVVEEEALDDDPLPDRPSGFNEEVPPMKVQPHRKRFSQKKKSSPIKTVLGVMLGPLIALPLAGGILAFLGKLPDWGFYPADGSFYNSGSTLVVSQNPGTPRIPSPAISRDGDLGQLLSDADPSEAQFVPPSELIPPEPEVAIPEPEVAVPEITGAGPAESPALVDPPGESEALTVGEPELPAAAAGTEKQINPFGDGKISMEFTPPEDREKKAGEITDDGSSDLVDQLMDLGAVEADGADVASAEPAGDAVDALFKGADEAANVEIKRPEPMKLPPIDTSDVDPIVANVNPAVPSMLPASPTGAGPGEDTPFGASVSLDGPGDTDSPELVSASKKALDAMLKLVQKKASGRTTIRDTAQAYRDIAAVGDIQAPSTSATVRNLLTQVGQSSLLDELGGTFAAEWFKYGAKRPHEGVFLVGLPGTDGQGRKTITLSTGEVIQVTLNRAGDLPKSGERVIGLGRIVSGGDSKQVQLIGAMGLN